MARHRRRNRSTGAIGGLGGQLVDPPEPGQGDSYDNALAENLWMLVKTECVRGRVFATRAEA
ncbi:hypothetical protein ACFVZX_41970, partial [Streptomyces erythrochromogenes]